ncbi:VanZ family protein [Streptomyces sp. SMC 277]|uniref:VanZ family protein n=2 Tax=Streptomyces antimicrobicus TaxID=2883108 RepID=A0ABS8B3V0_9ACTN|nr:VanZ family protein [Streptomyces antimicrobicus]MCB5179252.1 VanZ family protein [Streptomyces antimicrobicus]
MRLRSAGGRRRLPHQADRAGRAGPVDRAARPAPPGRPVVRALAVLAALVGTVVFSLVLARVTLEPSAASAGIAHSNVHPGASIRLYLEEYPVRVAAEQLGGNLLLGVPFGVLLPVLAPQTRGLLRVAAVTALVMTLVELIQGALVTGRAFDIDDVLLNTVGALLGFLLLGRRTSRAVHPRRRHWWHRLPGAGRRAAPAPYHGPRDAAACPPDSWAHGPGIRTDGDHRGGRGHDDS